MYWFLVNRRMTVHSHTMFACKPVNLVLRHRNLYPYANAGIDLSGKANPFDTRFHSRLRGEPDGTRTHSPYLKRVLRYRCATGSCCRLYVSCMHPLSFTDNPMSFKQLSLSHPSAKAIPFFIDLRKYGRRGGT